MATAIGVGQPVMFRRATQTYGFLALTIAVAFHFAGVGAYWLSEGLRGDEVVGPGGGSRPVLPDQPQTIIEVSSPRGYDAGAPLALPSKGIPVPVPDVSVSSQSTIPTQDDLRKEAGPSQGQGGGALTALPGSGDGTGTDDDTAPPDTFRPLEKLPEIITRAIPKYPELARQVGLQGRVIVNIWVDRYGRPRKAVVLKSDAEIFNQSAVDAAMQYRFTPGIMNRGPVPVWVTIPFTFRLKQSQ